MFTGIIQKRGKIVAIERKTTQGAGICVETGFSDLILGESVAVNGACLTVSEFTPNAPKSPSTALFFLSRETLDRTNLGDLQVGSIVNLERALQAGERLSGHIVQGHVDGKGKITQIQAQGESHLLEIEIPAELARYCVEKGSITLDGVSLTINQMSATLNSSPSPGSPGSSDSPDSQGSPARVSITLIPHTWTHTRFSNSAIGDSVNLEVDILAKYVEKLCQPYRKP